MPGPPVAYSYFLRTFNKALVISGVGAGSPVKPHVHDLRHSFAMRTLTGWCRDRLDIDVLMPQLSTYLGHREPRYTYWYLTATPELLGHAAGRLEAHRQAVTMVLAGTLLGRLPLNSAMIYLGLGWLLGPDGIDVLRPDPFVHAAMLERLAELGLLISLFAVGLRLGVPLRDVRWRLPLRLAFLSILGSEWISSK